MKIPLKLVLGSAAIAALAACGGGGGDTAAVPPAAPAPTTTAVAVTVMDGLIQGATVCLDVNSNGACDSGEPSGPTNAQGVASLTVPNADVGKFPVLAIVPVGAVDADNGPVTTAYTLTAPADQTAVISPLTTLVQLAVASTGVSTDEAAALVQSQAGLAASPLANYIAANDSTAASTARLLVGVIQSQTSALAATPDATLAEIQKAIMGNLGNLLAAAVAAGSSTEVVDACQADKAAAGCKAAIATAVTTLVADSGLTSTDIALAVTLARLPAEAPVAETPVAGFSLDWVNAGDANNWYTRVLASTAAEATPDANGLTRYRSIRHLRENGVDTEWANNSNPLRQGDLHWNGSLWVGCTVSTINTSKVRDAQGRSNYNYCDSFSRGTTQRVTTDISGKSMDDIFTLIQRTRTGGLNWGEAPAWFTGLVTASVDAAVFPTGSKLYTQSDSTTATAIAFDVRSSNMVTVPPADVAAGGDSRANASIPCNGNWTSTPAETLETLVARNQGNACIYTAPGSTVGKDGVRYFSGNRNEGWGGSTVSLGTLGTAPIGVATATSYFSGNIRFRAAFTGSNGVNFYACPSRSTDDSVRNCNAIGTGTYAIRTLGDARVLEFAAFPAQMAAMAYQRVFVERGGEVYWGVQEKLGTSQVLRLNGTAGNAALAQLGLPTITP
nr:hypothetical protein [uncultured Albidiferax sp.]